MKKGGDHSLREGIGMDLPWSLLDWYSAPIGVPRPGGLAIAAAPWWESLLGLPSDGTSPANPVSLVASLLGWGILLLLFLVVTARVGTEAFRLWLKRRRGIPLLALGQFLDPALRLPGLPHYLAAHMNDAGLTVFDEKGAVQPDFDLIGETGLPQVKLLANLMEVAYSRQFQRIHVEIMESGGLVYAAPSLVDSATGYVRCLPVVSADPAAYGRPGELVTVVARRVADTILVALSRDPNTRGLLYQRMGNWAEALREFSRAAEQSRLKGECGEYYQAHLNLGNLYSFLGLQDRSVAAYTEVAQRARSPRTAALIQAALACSYRTWAETTPGEQRSLYERLAEEAIEKAVDSPHKSPLIHYTIASYYSLSNQYADCLAWLREAVAGDLSYLTYALTDPDMENLRTWLGDRPLSEALGLRL